MSYSFFKCCSLTLCVLYSCITYSQSTPITISKDCRDTGVLQFIQEIEKEYNVQFYYQTEWIKDIPLNETFQNTPLENALNHIFEKTAYTFVTINETHFVVVPKKELNYSYSVSDSELIVNENSTGRKIGADNVLPNGAKAKVKGLIKDGATEESLPGANILILNTNYATVTGINGAFSLDLPIGSYQMQVSSIGYETSNLNVDIVGNGEMVIELFEASHAIDEVAVYAEGADRNIQSTQMSMVELNAKALKKMPTVIGEKDVIKSFTMMPGVQSVGEFGSGINVRGGGEDQNLYLLEGAPIFNTAHVFGLLSVVNPDAVNKVTLYKGHIPAEFGERVSSVMDIKTAENGFDKMHVKGGVGLFNSRLMAKVPLVKNKVSLAVAGRTNYSNWILHSIPEYDLQNSSTTFYDVTATLNARFKKDFITLFAYKSNDYFKYASDYAYNYGNNLLSAQWLHIYGSSLNGKLLLANSNYLVDKDEFDVSQSAKQVTTGINHTSVKYHFSYTGITKNHFQFGAQGIYYNIAPGEKNPIGELSHEEYEVLEKENAVEVAFYTADKISFNERLSIDLGLRAVQYMFLGPKLVNNYKQGIPLSDTSITQKTDFSNNELIKSYLSIEPRVSLKYNTTANSSVKFSYNHNKQFISRLSFTSIATPEDIWKLADAYFKPITSDQVALGYYRNFKANTIETSVEVYYKHLQNLYEFKNDAQTEMNPHIETEVIQALGKSYGIELLAKRKTGVLTGWVSYTYSRSLRKTNGVFNEEIINGNNWFASSYDKPHNLSLVATYNINKRVRLTTTFNYSTGRAVTLPEYQYPSGVAITTPDGEHVISNPQNTVYYSDRNKYRLPDYHRLDLALSIDESFRKSKKWKGSWTFSLINVYGRKNAYSVFYEKQEPGFSNNNKMYSLYKLYIIGIPLPSITYNFIF